MAGTWTCSEDEDFGSLGSDKVIVTAGTSGVPADYASFIAADRAGEAVLLAAIACAANMTLSYQIRPVEDLALQISFILSGTSAGAGDTLDVTGTDWEGNAQGPESIDVSGGDGTYNGANKWRTITDIDCTGWADGTLRVTQPRWGLIWDYGNSQLLLSCKFDIGDASTSTYFADSRKQITIADGIVTVNNQRIITVTANATYVDGVLNDETTRSVGEGSAFHLVETTYRDISLFGQLAGTLYLYGSQFLSEKYDANEARNFIKRLGAVTDFRMWGCLLTAGIQIGNYQSGEGSIERTDLYCARYGLITLANTMSDIFIKGCGNAIYGGGSSTVVFNKVIVADSRINAIYAWNLSGVIILLDCTLDDWTAVTFAGSPTSGTVNRRYTFNAFVADTDGNTVANANVLCQDKDGAQVFDVTTGALGAITEQEIDYQVLTWDGSLVTTTKSPHKFTISKANYQTLILDDITVDSPFIWHLELQQQKQSPAPWQEGVM